jgi:DNA-binding response OmpR family regulator
MQETIIVQETDKEVMEALCLALKWKVLLFFRLPTVMKITLDYIKQIRPHIIMLYYKLDGHICMGMYRRIKESFPHLPVIAMSCNSNVHVEYNKAGFDAYIKKPFDLDLLYRIVRKYVANRTQQAK